MLLRTLFLLVLSLVLPLVPATAQVLYTSPTLEIRQLTPHTFVHETYLVYEGSKVGCNGLIYIKEGEAAVFDTPTTDSVSRELMAWIKTRKARIKAVVVNHFHADCLGGLKAFHEAGVYSYAHEKTIAAARADKDHQPELPQRGFSGLQVLLVGQGRVINRHLGEAHTRDNIVSYIEEEQVLFGGCQVKCLGAGRGNLADANLKAWTATARKVKATYPKAKHVVPGHGPVGGLDLLDYTAQLFEKEK